MTAYEAMVAILDVNETLIDLRKRNNGNSPDQLDAKMMKLLSDYRELLTEEMKATTLEVFTQ